MTSNDPISIQDAYKLCKKYRSEHKVRLFSQCWGCVKYSKEEPTKMCFYNPPNNRGCRFVNQLLDGSQWNQQGSSDTVSRINIFKVYFNHAKE